jgi:hypothetical protein
MKSILKAVLCLCLGACAYGQTMIVSGSQLTDSANNPVSNATITFTPVLTNGQPASYRKGGTGGQAIVTPITTNVVDGTFSVVLPDTSMTNPSNLCFAVTATDNVTGNSLIGQGYGCVQPTANAYWCSSNTCNFDVYNPALLAQSQIQSGPAGKQGNAGPVGPTGTITTASGVINANVNNWQNPLMQGIGSNALTSTATVTGTSGSGSITLSAGSDFANTQGVMIAHAGAACGSVKGGSCASAPTPGVGIWGTVGSTTYNYRLACIDGLGGYGPAGTSGSTTQGAATLTGTTTGTVLSGNYNAVTWTGEANCPEVAIYRNSSLIATEYSAASGTMTYNDMGVAAWANRDIPLSPPSTGLHDNYVGIISGISGTAATVTPSLGASVSGATIYHSDTPLIQAAINASAFVNIPPGTYLINYPLNYTKAGSSVAYGVAGTLTGSAVLLMDTGDIGLDVTGDDNVVLSEFSMQAGPTNPSSIGIYCSRDSTLHTAVAQDINTKDLILALGSNGHALGGLGAVGFYNHACEIQHNYDDQFQIDRWTVLTATNVDHVTSLFDTNDIPGFQSMSEVEFYGANGGSNQIFGEFENAYSITWIGGYGDSDFPAAYPWAFHVVGNQSGRLTIQDFRVEGKGGLIDVASGAQLIEPTINTDLYRSPTQLTNTPQIRLNGSASLQDAPLVMIDDYGGSGANFTALVDGGTGCAVANSHLFVGVWQTLGTCQTTGLANTITGNLQGDWSLQPDYQLTASPSATWVKLGTWVSSTPGVGASLGITINGGFGFNPGQNNQATAHIVIRNGNGSSAPNLSGASMLVYGDNPFTAFKVAATGGSTSATNMSWDVYVQEGVFASGNYHIDKTPSDQWININTLSSDPGTSASVVVGTIQTVAPTSVGTPSTSSATCTPPQVEYDASYAYFCTTANTWRRAATSSF